MVRWTQTRKQEADSRGWGIFAIDGDQSRLAIQRLDESDLFESDEAALAHVKQTATGGDSTCQLALEIVGIQWDTTPPAARFNR